MILGRDGGLDDHHAHVQPTGAYHYHGLPTGLIEHLRKEKDDNKMLLIGYAADGFPIYDQSQSFPGAFVATCHSGVTLAANHVLALAPLIREGALPAEFQPFSARRLHVPSAA